MDDSRIKSKIPFKQSDKFLVIFLIIALLLVQAILNMIFGQSHQNSVKVNVEKFSRTNQNELLLNYPNTILKFTTPAANPIKTSKTWLIK